MRASAKVLRKLDPTSPISDNQALGDGDDVVRPLAEVADPLVPLAVVGTVGHSLGEAPRRPARELRREATVQDSDLEAATAKYTSKRLMPKWFLDGSLLDKLAVPRREITIASACSGSAGDVFVAGSIEKAYKVSDGRGPTIKHLFSCEASPSKRQWIQGIYAATALSTASGQGARRERAEASCQNVCSPCLFTDITDLAGGRACCESHFGLDGKPRRCPVQRCDIFVCSTSCKDMSRMSSASGQDVLNQRESVGGSAQTHHGMMGYIETYRPRGVIYENVDSVSDNVPGASMTNEDILQSDFASRGYEIQKIFASSSQFGLPQDRQRYYIIAVLVVASPALEFDSRSINTVFKTLRALITVCRREAPCASTLVYPHTHKRVQQDLAARQRNKTKESEYAVHNVIASCA